MIPLSLLLFFVLGTAVGSFLNVIAYRSVHGGSVWFSRSICPSCKHKLSTVDLVPIFSFIILKGKCRHCGRPISWQYPVVELTTGLIFAFIFWYWYTGSAVPGALPNLANLGFLLFAAGVLIVLTVTDLRNGLLPNSIVLPATALVAAYKGTLAIFGSYPASYLGFDLLAAFVVAVIFFLIVYISSEKAMGGGDIKLVFFLGIAVGWPLFVPALFLGFLTGGTVAAMLVLTGKKRMKGTLPLGPFLNLGALVALLYGQQILDLYLRAIG